jgi:hypothetical protein
LRRRSMDMAMGTRGGRALNFREEKLSIIAADREQWLSQPVHIRIVHGKAALEATLVAAGPQCHWPAAARMGPGDAALTALRAG